MHIFVLIFHYASRHGFSSLQQYIPKAGGSCWSSQPAVALFESLTVWNCEKGAELVNVGAIKVRVAENVVAYPTELLIVWITKNALISEQTCDLFKEVEVMVKGNYNNGTCMRMHTYLCRLRVFLKTDPLFDNSQNLMYRIGILVFKRVIGLVKEE